MGETNLAVGLVARTEKVYFEFLLTQSTRPPI